MTEKRRENSDSPILFLGISQSYLRAFEIVWTNEFEGRNKFFWKRELIFHPISQMLGIALETAVKGLLFCREGSAPYSHDLENLFSRMKDDRLVELLDQSICELDVPDSYYECNTDKPPEDVERVYRTHALHIRLINRVYDRPYASRYPVLGGHSLPDPEALERMLRVLLTVLERECRSWKPKRGS